MMLFFLFFFFVFVFCSCCLFGVKIQCAKTCQVCRIHLARHSERGKKTRQTEEKVGRQHQGTDRPGVRQAPEGSGEMGKMEETGCEVICVAPTTLAVNRG